VIMTAFPVVNSYNDWDPLEEVIVGSAFHLDYSNDVSFKLFFAQNRPSEPEPIRRTRFVTFGAEPTNRLRDELLEDQEGFISLLEGEGVRVRRPEALTEVKVVQTPDWRAALGHALMSRDLFMIVGQEIIETAPMLRSRYFESHLYKELFTEYFNQGAKWTVAPHSRLLDRNFDYRHAVKVGYTGPLPDEEPFFEIMFDGPQVLRLGRDLVFNCSTENHRMGLRWLQRHLGDGFRVHEIGITDHHIDGLVVPLRPGMLLLHAKVDPDDLPKPLHKWDRIVYGAVDDPRGLDNAGLPLLASAAIGINVLSLDEEKVVVQDVQAPLIEELEKAGFTPMPCRWRHGRTVGGAFHCMTLDVRRRGTPEDYFGDS